MLTIVLSVFSMLSIIFQAAFYQRVEHFKRRKENKIELHNVFYCEISYIHLLTHIGFARMSHRNTDLTLDAMRSLHCQFLK